MSIIDPEILKMSHEGTTIIEVRNAQGYVIGYKGRFLSHVYDNFTEALRENSKVNRENQLKKEGKNEHGQTKEQAEEFNKRKRYQQQLREKADMALAAAAGELKR